MNDIQVAGRMERTVHDLERACLQKLEWEQGQLLPDNGLIAVLCDTVRLARESSDMFKENAALKESLALAEEALHHYEACRPDPLNSFCGSVAQEYFIKLGREKPNGKSRNSSKS